MEQNNYKSLFGLILGMYILLGVIVIFNIYFTPNTDNELMDKINTLDEKITLIQNKRDSLVIIIDSIDNKIDNNYKNYEKTLNDIYIQSSSDDSLYILDYIRRYIEKGNSSNIR